LYSERLFLPFVKYLPDQTAKEEAETHENALVEGLADDKEIKRRKQI
jgi:hypothetical protein